MTRIPRWLVVIVVLLVALPLAGAAVLKAMFPPDRLREIAVPQLESRFGRDVSLGAVKLKVFPYIAIRLQNLAVANPPGFSSSPTVQLDALDLRLELWPLLRREYKLSQVRLIGPILRYEVAADGTNNLAGILAADIATDTAAAGAAGAVDGEDSRSAPGFYVKDLVVVNGGILYRNAATGRAIRVRVNGNLNVTPARRAGRTMASDGKFKFAGGLMVAGGRDTTRLPDVEIEYRVLFNPSDGRIAVPELRIRTAGLTLEGTGVSQVTDRAVQADEAAGAGRLDATAARGRTIRLDLASDEFEIADLLAQLPQPRRKSAFSVEGRATLAIRWAGSLGGPDGETPNLTGTATYSELAVSTPERGQLVSGASGTVSFTPDMFNAPDITGRLLGRPFRARVHVRDFENPSIDGHLTGVFDLAQLQEFRKGEPLPVTGSAAIDIQFRGRARETERWDINGAIHLTKFSYESPRLPAPAEIADATIHLSGGGIRADAVLIRFGDSDVSVTFSSTQFVRYMLSDPEVRGVAPSIEFTARSNRLATSDLRRERPAIGYSDLVKARLTGRQVDGQDPETIARARYQLPELADYRASGSMSITEWVNPPTNAEDVSFQIELADGVIEISQVRGGVYGGRLSGGLRLDLNTSQHPHELEYDLNLETAQAGALLERWTTLGPRLTGTVNFDITGSSPLDDGFLPMPAGFSAVGSVNFIEGRFEDFGITDAVKRRFSLAPDKLSRFKNLGGPFEIRDGQFVVQNWSFGAGDITGVISGSAGLGGVLDLDLSAMLPVAAIRNAGIVGNNPALGALLNQLSGGGDYIPVKLDVGGTLDSPALQLDAEALAATLRDQVQIQGRNRLQDAGRNLLEELMAPASAQAPAPAPAPAPEESEDAQEADDAQNP